MQRCCWVFPHSTAAGGRPILLFYIHSTWTHHHCYATLCFLHWNTSLLLRNMMFLTLEDIFTATQHDVSCTGTHVGATQHDVWGWGVCFWVGWGWGGWGVGWGVGCFRSLHLHASWCYATWCFFHWNTSLLPRNMMFLAQSLLHGCKKELGCSGRNSRDIQPSNYLRAFVHQWNTEEKSLPMTMTFYSNTFFFYKNEKTEFLKVLTNRFACKHLIYNGRHLEWQCIISKKKVNTCAAIEGRCTLPPMAIAIPGVLTSRKGGVWFHCCSFACSFGNCFGCRFGCCFGCCLVPRL